MDDVNPPANPHYSPAQPSMHPKIATTVEISASSIDDALRQALVYQKTITETVDSNIDASKSRLSQIRDASIVRLTTIPHLHWSSSEFEIQTIDDALRQVLVYQKTIDSTIDASKSRLSQIRDTSVAHTSQTIDSLRDIVSEYNVYDHMVFGKIKDGVNVAASHPVISGSLAFGVGLFALKKTRRFVYYNTLRMFLSEKALLSRADLKVKELRQSMDRLKAESEKLERVETLAEDELIRGRMKLREAGKQIQGAICSAFKIEKQATGLKDVLNELPTREASRFRSQSAATVAEDVIQKKYKLDTRFPYYNTFSSNTTQAAWKRIAARLYSTGNETKSYSYDFIRSEHAHLLKIGSASKYTDLLIRYYSEKGQIEDAEYVFQSEPNKTLEQWNNIIWAYANNWPGKTLEAFQKMKESKVDPSLETVRAVLVGCDNAGLVDEAMCFIKQLNEESKELGLKDFKEAHFGVLIVMFMRNGLYKAAIQAIECMPFQLSPSMINSVFGFCKTDMEVQQFNDYLCSKKVRFQVLPNMTWKFPNVIWGEYMSFGIRHTSSS